MTFNKPHRFNILGHEAILLNGRVEISLPNEDDGHKIIMKLSSSILNDKIKSLRLNFPNKIVFISAKDSNHILMRAEEPNDKKALN